MPWGHASPRICWPCRRAVTTVPRVIRRSVPVLWLCGPSGVGKTSVGWEIFTQLDAAGIKTGYLDIDQVGLCYPGSADDPDNHGIKRQNVGVTWPTFRAAGAQCLVLSGLVESRELARSYAELLPETELTLCRLRVGHDELRNRFIQRGWRTDLVEDTIKDAAVLDHSNFADLSVDTHGLSVRAVAALVRKQAGGWPQGLTP
jgi:hypothetical protein